MLRSQTRAGRRETHRELLGSPGRGRPRERASKRQLGVLRSSPRTTDVDGWQLRRPDAAADARPAGVGACGTLRTTSRPAADAPSPLGHFASKTKRSQQRPPSVGRRKQSSAPPGERYHPPLDFAPAPLARAIQIVAPHSVRFDVVSARFNRCVASTASASATAQRLSRASAP